MYLFSGNSIHKDVDYGLRTALGESNYAACSQSAQPQMARPRYIRAIIPILTPEICKWSDPRDAYCHVSRDRLILWRSCIQGIYRYVVDECQHARLIHVPNFGVIFDESCMRPLLF